MEGKRYRLLDEEGKAVIVKKDKDRYIGLDELAQHIAMDIVDDYQSILDGDKKIEDTNIELSIKVLTAISPVIKTYQKCFMLRNGFSATSTLDN